MKPIVYIAGPMTGYKDHNFRAFDAAERKLSEDYTVINPASFGVMEGWFWTDYMRRDIVMLMRASAIYMLSGWRFSSGASLEYDIARELGLDVMEEE